MSNKLKILVTGSSGQLGKCIEKISGSYVNFDFYFYSRPTFLLDNADTMRSAFELVKPDFCINCAAYTAVDKAEEEKAFAYAANADGVGNLAALCEVYQTKFIHISTDYVFNGTASSPYVEVDSLDPINVYGASKAAGEKLALANCPSAIIIRTSWVYSLYGKNFVKTMINLMNQKDSIGVVNDQKGSPTYAKDLAIAIMHIVSFKEWMPGIFHFSNKGIISWYEFALSIQKKINSKCVVNAIPTSAYPTPAKRPAFTVLNTSKIEKTFQMTIPKWEDSLNDFFADYKSERN